MKEGFYWLRHRRDGIVTVGHTDAEGLTRVPGNIWVFEPDDLHLIFEVLGIRERPAFHIPSAPESPIRLGAVDILLLLACFGLFCGAVSAVFLSR